jgi:peptidoglycan/LPS O-acetylase OafA/YrhL
VVAAFPVNVALAVTVALVSYYLVEQPSLRLRRRIERTLDKRRAGSTSSSFDAPTRLIADPIISEAGH